MARKNLRLSFRGIGEVARSTEMHRAVQELAEQVAANVGKQGLTAQAPGEESSANLTAEVEMTTTDRARASVVVKHPSALGMQAKHGILTNAASEAGLEVKGKG